MIDSSQAAKVSLSLISWMDQTVKDKVSLQFESGL